MPCAKNIGILFNGEAFQALSIFLSMEYSSFDVHFLECQHIPSVRVYASGNLAIILYVSIL